MAIRILDCAPLSPWLPRWHVGTACLLVETDKGLVLVDTGLGLHDHLTPTLKVRFLRLDLGSHYDPDSTAIRQLQHLGHSPEHVRHIVMTHLHFDHAGGLPDFPEAFVHVHRLEHVAINQPRTWLEFAYDSSDFAHHPRWVLYDQSDTAWQGLEAVRLPFTPDMYLVPLFGHTRGHCGVAIRDGPGWLFQCGDALPVNADFDITPQFLNRLVLGPHVERLRAWSASHPEVKLLAGHLWRSSFDTMSR